MTDKELMNAILGLSVETGSLACLGCGHEHGCGIHGCAILRQAAYRLGAQNEQFATAVNESLPAVLQVPYGPQGPCDRCRWNRAKVGGL